MRLLILIFTCCSFVNGERHPKMNILVFGGNGMMGGETIYQLLQEQEHEQTKHRIVTLNRGGQYYDYNERIKPLVDRIRCDRERLRTDCPKLTNDDTVYDYVLDFSCYQETNAQDTMKLLRGRFKHYIYISSDSVYEVSRRKTHSGFSKETDSVRPMSAQEQEQLNKLDMYGHRKLAIEEVLQDEHRKQNDAFKYLILRLPDVLGPRDNTVRWWKYYMWTKLHHVLQPVDIPIKFQNKQLSVVYSVDIARLIANTVLTGGKPQIWNNIYNLGSEQTITLKEVVIEMSKFLGYDNVTFDETDAADINFGIPSVLRGPVNISKAKALLDWQPTDLQIAIRMTCRFYEKAEYKDEYRNILDQVLEALGVRGEYYRDFLEIHQTRYYQQKQKEEL